MRSFARFLPIIALLSLGALACGSADTTGAGANTATGGSGGSAAHGGTGGSGGGAQPLRATIDTSEGIIVVDLEPTLTPVTVENFKKYADAQFYDGLVFHRVIVDFMIQGGGLSPDMTEKDPLFAPIVNEAVGSGLSNVAGTIAMARTSAPNSATSQFYINTVDNTYLDPSTDNPAGYAVFGMVSTGMDVVETIENVPTHTVGAYDDVPVTTVLINSIVVEPI